MDNHKHALRVSLRSSMLILKRLPYQMSPILEALAADGTSIPPAPTALWQSWNSFRQCTARAPVCHVISHQLVSYTFLMPEHQWDTWSLPMHTGVLTGTHQCRFDGREGRTGWGRVEQGGEGEQGRYRNRLGPRRERLQQQQRLPILALFPDPIQMDLYQQMFPYLEETSMTAPHKIQ